MLEIIKQLALDAAEKGADFCVGTVTKAAPLTIRLEEGLELTEAFLVLTEDVLQAEEAKQSFAGRRGGGTAAGRRRTAIFGAWESTKGRIG